MQKISSWNSVDWDQRMNKIVKVPLHRKFFHSYSHQILHEEGPDQENRKQREGAWWFRRKGQAILFCSNCSWNHWCIMGLFENIFCLTLLYHCYLSCVCRYNMIILRQVLVIGGCDGSEGLKWWHHTLSKIATLSKTVLLWAKSMEANGRISKTDWSEYFRLQIILI